MAPIASSQFRESWDSNETLRESFPDREPHEGEASNVDRDGDRAGITGALRARLKGPGGFYNVGNVVALTTGLGIQIAAAAGEGGEKSRAVLEAVRQYFVGSPGATALTLAIAIFFVSGEMYHRAWLHGLPPDRRMNRWGDLLSGIGALMLTVALAAFGDVALAIASGALLAAGKFGSALVPENYSTPGCNPWPHRCRVAVVASRVPAFAALTLELVRLLGAHTMPRGSLVMTVVMLFCYLLWTRADFLLFAGSAERAADKKSA